MALVTVAGNLDHAAWTEHHRLLPLTDSVSAEAYRARLQHLPQWHLVGGRDRIIPPALVHAYADSVSPLAVQGVIELADFDHRCCWAEHWPSLSDTIMEHVHRIEASP